MKPAPARFEHAARKNEGRLTRGFVRKTGEVMLQVLFNGTRYVIAPITEIHSGWSAIDSAGTVEEGYAKSKKDWDHFGNLCGIVPSRST